MQLALDDPFDIEDKLGNNIDVMINAGVLTTKLTTIIDMTVSPPELIRQGAGDATLLIDE